MKDEGGRREGADLKRLRVAAVYQECRPKSVARCRWASVKDWRGGMFEPDGG